MPTEAGMQVQDQNQAEASVDSPVNYETEFSAEELRDAIANNTAPVKTAAPEPAPEVVEEPAKDEADKAEADKANEEKELELDNLSTEEVEEFKFTENADPETFAKEAKEYLETLEIPAPLQIILERQAAELETLRTAEPVAAEVPESDQRVINAFNTLGSKFVMDPDRQVHVPDTTELVKVLSTDFKEELPEVILALNSLPSAKYPGQTVYQEFLREYGGLDEAGMRNLETFLDNKGQLPIPTYVPDGIDPKVAEAYWKSPDREILDQTLEAAKATLADEMASDGERQLAKNAIQNIQARLVQLQKGLNSERQIEAQTKAQAEKQVEAIQAKAAQSYMDTSVEMLRSFSGKLAESLTLFDEKGAQVTALAYGTLIEKALTDDEWAKYAQEDLKVRGVDFDWKKGRMALDTLWDIEHRIADLEANFPTKTRAIELAKKDKATALKAIKALETDLFGRIAKVTIATVAPKAKAEAEGGEIQETKKLTVVRPKAKAPAPAALKNEPDLDSLSPEELQSRIGELRHIAREQGVHLA